MDTYDEIMGAPAGRSRSRGDPRQGDEYDFAIDFEPRREYRESDKEKAGTKSFGREWRNLMRAKKDAQQMLKPGRDPGASDLITEMCEGDDTRKPEANYPNAGKLDDELGHFVCLEGNEHELDTEGRIPDYGSDEKQTLAEQEDRWRFRFDAILGKIGPPGVRGGAHLILRFLHECWDQSKSELLLAKAFLLLVGDRYRSHFDELYVRRDDCWERSSAIAPDGLEHILSSCRYAQALMRILHRKGLQPDRDVNSVATEILYVANHLSPSFLQAEFQSDTLNYKLATKANNWRLGLSSLMKDMQKEISQHSDAIAHLFKEWGNSPMKPNLSSWAFLDCVVDLSTMSFVERGQEHNCYARIPVRLLRKVNTEDELRLSRFLRSSFAGKESGLDLLLATCAIVARGDRVPDSLLIFIGKGGEGKSALLRSLFRKVWGSTFAGLPPAVIQKEDEFRKQGRNFIGTRWHTIDESNPNHGLQTEELKVYTAGE